VRVFGEEFCGEEAEAVAGACDEDAHLDCDAE